MKWHKSLAKWRTDRNISRTSAYPSMIKEELEEYSAAPTTDDLVDAICDVIVLTENQAQLEGVQLDYKATLISNLLYDSYVTYRLTLYDATSSTNEDILQEIYAISHSALLKLGYSLKLAMKETLKEISSRNQDPIQAYDWSINGPSGKWLKDPNQNPVTLYKANYKLAKIKETT